MSEKLISPGVLTKEIDASFLPAAVGAIGAAIIGPANKGPILVPTIINSVSELEEVFGNTYESGSGETFEYFTTLTAKNYLKNKGPVTIVRVAGDGSAIASNSSFSNGDINSLLTASIEVYGTSSGLNQAFNDKGAFIIQSSAGVCTC